MIDWSVIPARTALINIDLQNVFVEGYDISTPEGPAVVDRLNALSTVAREAGVTVIHTAQEARADGANRGYASDVVAAYLEGRNMVRGSNLSGSHPVQFSPRLKIEKGDILLVKPRYGAFTATDLDLILRRRGIDTVIIGGIATNVCCDTTAREAATREYRVFFLSDGTANRALGNLSADTVKAVTLETLRFCFAQVLTVAEMADKIRTGAGVKPGAD
jgi:ureidoacrylate peracid hydrolase